MNDLVQHVGDRLARHGLRLAIAESCTGGMLATRLTDRPGASRYLIAGLVTYADESKTRFLGVRPGTLAAHGAVSEAVALEMAQGARLACAADMAVAITGIAGPGGATDEKPVGTVWIAVTVHENQLSRACRFDGDRAAVREHAVRAALEMMDSTLSQLEAPLRRS